MREEKKKNYMEEFNKLNEKEVVNDERLEEDEWEKNKTFLKIIKKTLYYMRIINIKSKREMRNIKSNFKF